MTNEEVIKIKISFEFLFLRALLFSLKVFNEEFLKLKSFSSQEIRELLFTSFSLDLQ